MTFGGLAPASLVKADKSDISDLLLLESSGLIQGASGLGLAKTLSFNKDGNAFLREGDVIILYQGPPGEKFSINSCILTSLGNELIKLIADRNVSK